MISRKAKKRRAARREASIGADGQQRWSLRKDPEVARVTFDESRQHVDPTGRYFQVEVVGKSEYGSPPALDFVHRLLPETIDSRFGIR